jgi:hypothetical protein
MAEIHGQRICDGSAEVLLEIVDCLRAQRLGQSQAQDDVRVDSGRPSWGGTPWSEGWS